MTTAFPLAWPSHRPRTTAARRKNASFNKKQDNGRYLETKQLTVADAIKRMQSEIDAIGGRYPVISSNVETRLDGLPRSGQPEPDDPGVCLYFDLKGKPMALPCDTYNRVADNMAAIAAHMEATRKIERHGVATVAEMFAGFVALPAPSEPQKRDWRDVLDLNADERSRVSKAIIEGRYRYLAAKRHPDRSGGSHEAMAELNRARDEALKEIS